jgi:hypothetical protein
MLAGTISQTTRRKAGDEQPAQSRLLAEEERRDAEQQPRADHDQRPGIHPGVDELQAGQVCQQVDGQGQDGQRHQRQAKEKRCFLVHENLLMVLGMSRVEQDRRRTTLPV